MGVCNDAESAIYQQREQTVLTFAIAPLYHAKAATGKIMKREL